MAVQIQGQGGTVAEVDGTTFRSLRITSKPYEYGAFGFYRSSVTIALLATQAVNGSLFSFRWGDATRLCVIQDIRLQFLQTVAATATIWPNYSVFIARAFSASDSAGTAPVLTGNSFKKRTSMGTTLLTDLRYSALAAGLTAGTRTLDGQPILVLPTQLAITTTNQSLYTTNLDMDSATAHPYVLAQNEGVIVQGPSTVFGAAGAGTLTVNIAWAEVAAF